MSNENETNEDEFCLGCQLTDEYYQLLEDGVSEEAALRYVIHTAMDIKDELVADLIDEAFEDGLALGVNNAKLAMSDYAKETEDRIADYRAEKEAESNVELDKESEEIEDISDEDFEKLTKIIFDNK